MIDVSTYADAREFFEAVRSASREISRSKRQLEVMELRESDSGDPYAPKVSHSRVDVNGTGRAIARMDFERRIRQRMDDDYVMLDLASQVLYGTSNDGSGGVDSLLGTEYADVLFWRYCDGSTWERTAQTCGWSRAETIRKANVAFETIDSVGLRNVLDGSGVAEQ